MLDNMFSQTVMGPAKAISTFFNYRDPYTVFHEKRVGALAEQIAKKMNQFSDYDILGIKISGMLHDVGKICVPMDILNKPGVISEHEMNIIREHPQVGFNVLSEIAFPWPVARVALEHHERLDGSGYPHNLTKNEIHIFSQIVAVADVVEAISAFRPYRPALGIDVALNEIREKNEKYNKDVVRACLELFEQDNYVFPQKQEMPLI